MTKDERGKSQVLQARTARAAAALRENLKRRKERARGRKAYQAGEGAPKSHDSAEFVPDKPKG